MPLLTMKTLDHVLKAHTNHDGETQVGHENNGLKFVVVTCRTCGVCISLEQDPKVPMYDRLN